MHLPQHIRKSNALIEASYRLSVFEQRIILSCISQLPAMQEITDDVMYTVRSSDISKLSGTKSQSTYKELKEASLRLKRREVWIKTKPNSIEKHKKTMVTGWVQTINYLDAEGAVELRFTKDILPYISQISSHYTPYELRDVIKINNSYAIRLYEMLMQWSGKGFRELAIEKLREALQLEDKYKSNKDLKKYVIEPAVKQLNEHSPLNIKWNQRKTGRSISHLLFFFEEKPQLTKESGVQLELEPGESNKPVNSNPKTRSAKEKRAAVTAAVMDIEDTTW